MSGNSGSICWAEVTVRKTGTPPACRVRYILCWGLALATALSSAFLAAAPPAGKTLILATTTSTQDSGLLDDLIPRFEKQTGYAVKTIAVGSGQAIAMGRRGEADVLLVHSPEAEKALVLDGSGIRSHTAMEALQRIATTKAAFLSRGDNSGTHAMELKLWKTAGISVDGQAWYQQTGQGMGQTLAIAAEKRAYTLSDRGTYLALQKKLGLALLHEGDPSWCRKMSRHASKNSESQPLAHRYSSLMPRSRSRTPEGASTHVERHLQPPRLP